MALLLAPLLEVLLYLALARLFPARLSPEEAAEIAALKRRLGWWNLVYAFLYLPLTAAATVPVYLALSASAAAFHPDALAGAAYVLRPTAVALLLPAMFLGLLLAVVPLYPLGRALLGRERFAECVRSTRYEHGADARKVAAVFVPATAALALAMAVQLCRAYTAFHPDRMEVRTLWDVSGPATYRYADVAEVCAVEYWRAPAGNLRKRTHHVIRFVDGSRWSTYDFGNGREPVPKADTPAVEYVARRCGMPVRRYRSL